MTFAYYSIFSQLSIDLYDIIQTLFWYNQNDTKPVYLQFIFLKIDG